MKRILLSILLCVTTVTLTAQTNIAEKGFGFQGYARNLDGSAVSNQTVQVKFSIYPEGQSNEFEETQTLETDAFGVFTAEVGSVNTIPFSNLNFANSNYFLKVEVSVQGGNLFEISNTKLQSVPYAQAAANGVPTGTILPFGGETIPDGFVVCDGASYSKTDTKYKALATALNGAWGQSGNNFNVPDLRGMFLRGVDGGAGNDPNAGTRVAKNNGFSGDRVGSIQADGTALNGLGVAGGPDLTTSSNGAHTHTVDIFRDNIGNPDGALDIHTGGEQGRRYWRGNGATKQTDSRGAHTHTVTVNLESADSETRPLNAGVIYIIKL